MPSLSISLSPPLSSRLDTLHTYCSNYLILRDLKQYRPHRRPITRVPRDLEGNPGVKRKRHLIVRDWFYYVIWYIRLRKIVRNLVREEEGDGERRDQRYTEMLSMVDGMSPGEQLRVLKEKIRLSSKSETKGLANVCKDFVVRVPTV
jgi:hypothetical protein